jgi:hypothetical protein
MASHADLDHRWTVEEVEALVDTESHLPARGPNESSAPPSGEAPSHQLANQRRSRSSLLHFRDFFYKIEYVIRFHWRA